MKKICIIAFLVNIIFIQCYGEDFPALFFKEIEAQNFIGGQNIFRYWPGNLVDKDLSTAWAYSRAGTDNLFYTRAIVSFSFLNTNWIDEIRIWNGYGKSSDLWKKNNRAREISIFIGISGTKSFTNIEYVLKDTDGYQSIKFSPVLGNEVNVQILSTYPGTTYDDTCISEIEFWYQGQKYEVANLEQAKREFVRKVREKARWGVGDPYDTETYIKESGPEVERRLAGYGITNVEVLDMTGKMDIVGKRASVIRVRKWVPAEGNGYRMVLYAQKKGSGLKKRKVTTTDAEADVGEYEYELREVVKIGEAKVDENGTTWAKLGNSEWRAVVITSGYGRMLMSDYFEAFGIGDVDSEGHVAPFPEE